MNDFHQPFFPGLASGADRVALMSVSEITSRAVRLLIEQEPPEGYFLAFSGGKDSVVILELAKLAGVKFDAHHNFTTIDPPELVRFVKTFPEVVIDRPAKNMFARIAEHDAGPPNRHRRWCCEEYKESSGGGRAKIIGVRAEESRNRAIRWNEISRGLDKSPVVCPIVHWTKDQVWAFIRANKLPYCSLYDEGWDRIGCVGCPLANRNKQRREFERWPRFAENWKRAIIANWRKFKDLPKVKDGKPRFQSIFKSGEDFWQYWLTQRVQDWMREGCQSSFLFTNEEESDSERPGVIDASKYPDKDPDEDWTTYFERKGITP